MGFLPRRLIKQDLHLVDVYVEDLQNEFFNIVELPETFTSGRSAFKIFGSDLLKKGVKLKIEMLDSFGNTVYVVPVDLVGEEVKPHLPNSWMDRNKDKVGYEINFTKYFYKYKPLRSLGEITQDLLKLDEEIEGTMKEILD